MSNPLENYSTWELEESIGRLEGLRCALGWCDLAEDLEKAIESMEYLVAILQERDDE